MHFGLFFAYWIQGVKNSKEKQSSITQDKDTAGHGKEREYKDKIEKERARHGRKGQKKRENGRKGKGRTRQ